MYGFAALRGVEGRNPLYKNLRNIEFLIRSILEIAILSTA